MLKAEVLILNGHMLDLDIINVQDVQEQYQRNMNKENINTLMPYIIKITPNAIASDLVDVQPMSLNTGHIFKENYESEIERMLRVDFGGVDKDVIINILKKKFPENFI